MTTRSRGLRGDIQGLRAVAVLTVVAAHAGVPFLPGGFVGVDVFFVISGFLISTLLFGEAAREGRVSLTTFWSRRARRILPAATLVTVVTVLASLILLSAIDARQVVVDAAWAAAFAANINFARQDVDYFAAGSAESPMQHYWSLAVEEQFYVLWPVLVLGCLALARTLARRRAGSSPTAEVVAPALPRRTIGALLGVLTLASFTWSVVHTLGTPEAAYFSTLTRAWELGVGALLALLAPAAVHRLTRRGAGAMVLGGLGAVALAMVVITPQTPFPGYAAALPVLGTALVLLGGAAARPPRVGVLLDNPVMRTLGDWSFSIYLWHWPVLILAERSLGRSLTVLETVFAVLAALVLSGLSYRLVEEPFRAGRTARALRRPRWALVLYPASLGLVAATCLAAWQVSAGQLQEQGDNPPIAVAGDHDDTVALVRASVDAARQDVAIPSDLTPDLVELRESVADVGACDYSEGVRQLCPRGDTEAPRTLVLIGDSHARAWIPAFDEIAATAGWRTFYLVKSQCTAAHVTVAPLDEERPFTACDDFQDWVQEQVAELEPDVAVVASSPPVNGVFDGDRHYEGIEEVATLLDEGYRDLFADLQADADRVVLLRDVPKNPDDPGTCLSESDRSLSRCMFEPQERSRYLGDVAVAAARGSGAEVVDPTPWLCYEGVCPVVIGGTLSYRDTDHITAEYAASLAGPLGRAMGLIGD